MLVIRSHDKVSRLNACRCEREPSSLHLQHLVQIQFAAEDAANIVAAMYELEWNYAAEKKEQHLLLTPHHSGVSQADPP